MQYEIKLSGTSMDDGGIDLGRLELLAQYLQDIARGALQMRMFGTSVKRGRDTASITDALNIRLTGLSKGSTVLHLECQPFRETLKTAVQGNLFHQEILRRLPDETPVSLVMESFHDALNPESQGDLLDKPLLQDLQKFNKILINEAQSIEFSNNGSLPDLQLYKASFKQLKTVEERTPEPQRVVISGFVEELKFSKAKVTFIPERGRPFTGFLSEAIAAADMAKLWGQKATIKGIAHFKPNGQMAFVEIQTVQLAVPGDDIFSQTPLIETIEQQIQRQMQEGKGYKNPLKELANALADEPWETTLEEDLQLLRE
jgi:hypothetical protein